jgi:hypothetical protein
MLREVCCDDDGGGGGGCGKDDICVSSAIKIIYISPTTHKIKGDVWQRDCGC